MCESKKECLQMHRKKGECRRAYRISLPLTNGLLVGVDMVLVCHGAAAIQEVPLALIHEGADLYLGVSGVRSAN